jgi:regulator of replication initiation timing
MKRLRASDEWKGLDAALKSVPALQKQVTELNTKVNTFGVENVALKKQNDELKAQLASQGEDSVNLNALGKLLQWFLVRMGLK